MKSLFNDLENVMAKLETRWKKENYSTDVFTEVAFEETKDFDFSWFAEVKNQMKWMDMPGIRVQQVQSTFSDLYFQAYHNGRFMIEILNWWGGHVNVHDHDFAAVQFQLKGDALNAEYDFTTKREAGALRFGELKMQTAEVWTEGNVSKVYPGRDDAHSVFHLGEPTTSLLVRTVAAPRFGAQSNYFPNLAAHYYVSNTIQRKKLTALSLLARETPNDFCDTFSGFLDTQSLSENFFMMVKLGELLFQGRYVQLVANYAARGEDESEVVKAVVTNNGVDFFKSRVNSVKGLTQDERLAGFAVAASHSLEGFITLENSPKMSVYRASLRPSLKSFINKMSREDQLTAQRYLTVFGLSEVVSGSI